MKWLSILMSTIAVVLCGYLYQQSQKPVVGLEAGSNAVVEVANLTVRSEQDVRMPAAPKILETPMEDSKPEVSVAQTAPEEITVENAAQHTCVMLGPLPEKTLPRMKKFIESEKLVSRMQIEPQARARQTAVYVGPYTQGKAALLKGKLAAENAPQPSVHALKSGGFGVVVNVIDDPDEAQRWSLEYAHSRGLSNVRLTTVSDFSEPQVKLVFYSLSPEEVLNIKKEADKLRLPLTACSLL